MPTGSVTDGCGGIGSIVGRRSFTNDSSGPSFSGLVADDEPLVGV